MGFDVDFELGSHLGAFKVVAAAVSGFHGKVFLASGCRWLFCSHHLSFEEDFTQVLGSFVAQADGLLGLPDVVECSDC